MTRRRRGRVPRRDERGSATLEMVVLLPALLLLVIVGVQAALYYYAASIASAAAQDAARASASAKDHDWQATGTQRAQAALDQSHGGLEHAQVTVTGDVAGPHATVSGRCLALVPGLELQVVRSASMPWEELS